MKKIYNIVISFLIFCAFAPIDVFGIQNPNPRGGVASTSHADVSRNAKRNTSVLVSRSVSSKPVTARATSNNVKNVSLSRSATNKHKHTVNASRVAKSHVSSSIFSRSAKNAGNASIRNSGSAKARSAKNNSLKKLVRATAIYSDDSKIGGGYSGCKEAFNTCMDQFCGKANETYRRCYCSERFTEFRDTEDAVDQALSLLADFQNNNLNAVDKTAAEVSAMYSSTVGEDALKKDTSASQKMLDNITDILSGKKKSDTKANTSSSNTSLGTLNLSSFSTSLDDIWSGGDSAFSNNNSMWGSNSSSTDMTSLEGKALYDSVYQQCAQIVKDSCTNEAMFNLARSSYSILIMQDCNLYEKNINSKRLSVNDTVKTVEKTLREARLADFRAHNSKDVNECLTKVEDAIKKPTACGADYVKCLDYTGMYINASTGEPIYSSALFGLNSLIVLNGDADVVTSNQGFDEFLDSKRIFVESELDSCRTIADTVWSEFKRSAIIQIAQAQDNKIEEIKNSCVNTMKECYDSQSDALNNFDDTTAKASGAISAIAARDMCADKVMACAALYGDPNGCKYDDKTKKISNSGNGKCGLESLLAFVQTVDSVKVAEGCEAAIKGYAKELCAPVSGDDHEYPWGCRSLRIGQAATYDTKDGKTTRKTNTPGSLYDLLEQRADMFCGKDLMANTDLNNNITDQSGVIKKMVDDISEQLEGMLSEECEKLEGIWIGSGLAQSMMSAVVSNSKNNIVTAFYAKFFDGDKNTSVGTCSVNTVQSKCLAYNTDAEKSLAKYNTDKMICEFEEDWYKNQCSAIGGYYSNSVCYVGKN